MAASYTLNSFQFAVGITTKATKADGTVGSGTHEPGAQTTVALKDGTGDGKAKRFGVHAAVIAPGAHLDLDLTTVVNFWGAPVVVTPAADKVKGLAVVNDTPGGDAHVTVGPAPGNGFSGPLSGTNPAKQVKVGNPPELWLDAAGFADDLSANGVVRISNPSASTSANVRVFLAV